MSGGDWAGALRDQFSQPNPKAEGRGRGGAGAPLPQRTCSCISCSSELLSIEPGPGGRGRRPRPGGAALRMTPLRPGPCAPPAPPGAASRSRPPPPHAWPKHRRALHADRRTPRLGTDQPERPVPLAYSPHPSSPNPDSLPGGIAAPPEGTAAGKQPQAAHKPLLRTPLLLELRLQHPRHLFGEAPACQTCWSISGWAAKKAPGPHLWVPRPTGQLAKGGGGSSSHNAGQWQWRLQPQEGTVGPRQNPRGKAAAEIGRGPISWGEQVDPFNRGYRLGMLPQRPFEGPLRSPEPWSH